MKNVIVSGTRVLASLTLIASAVAAFAGPGSPAPVQQIHFAPATTVEIAGPGSPAPVQQIHFAPEAITVQA